MSKVLYKAMGADMPKAFQDGTHHTGYGALEIAKCVAQGIKDANLPLAKSLVDDFTRTVALVALFCVLVAGVIAFPLASLITHPIVVGWPTFQPALLVPFSTGVNKGVRAAKCALP